MLLRNQPAKIASPFAYRVKVILCLKEAVRWVVGNHTLIWQVSVWLFGRRGCHARAAHDTKLPTRVSSLVHRNPVEATTLRLLTCTDCGRATHLLGSFRGLRALRCRVA